MNTKSLKSKTPLYRSSANMLLIDDDPVFCMVMEKISEELNVALTTCSSFNELENLAVPEVFDVALVDYYLDGVSANLRGPAVTRLLGKTPSFLISRNDTCEFESGAWPKNIKGFIGKSSGPRGILSEALKFKNQNQVSH